MTTTEFIKKYCIAITGGIATGKSTVSNILKSNDFHTINADILSRKAVNPGSETLYHIVETFGAEILNPDKSLNRSALGSIIFNDPQKKKKLENIIHPRINELLNEEIKHSGLMEKKQLCFYEAALIYEIGRELDFKEVWVTICEEEEQIKRIMKRDHNSKEEAQSVIRAQMPIKEKAKRADFVIYTDKGPDEFSEKIIKRAQALASL